MPPQQQTDQQQLQDQMEARERAQSGAAQAFRSQRQQDLEELRMYKEIGEGELAAMHEQAALMKEKIRLRDSVAMEQQHIAAFEALDKIDPKKDLDPQIDQIEFSNPLVAKDPAFRQAVAHRYTEAANKAAAETRNFDTAVEIAKKYDIPLTQGKDGLYDVNVMINTGLAKIASAQSAAGALPGFKESERTVTSAGEVTQRFTSDKNADSKVRDAILSGKSVEGTQTGNGAGAVFTPRDASDTSPGTHQQVTYQNPNTGEVETKIVPMEFYKQLQMQALAEKALSDPAATEDHKAAARKILGAQSPPQPTVETPTSADEQ